MRIISGTFRGRRLTPPKNITARPTTDFAKESLFNLLTNRIDIAGTDVLDLFAGTGGIGLEFISRGAREVTAIELVHTQQNFIISTCKQLGINNLHLLRGDVFKFLRNGFANNLPPIPSQPNTLSSQPTTLSSQPTTLSSTPPVEWHGARYDIIFADPPYALSELPTLPYLIVPYLLKPNGLFVLEHGDQYDFSHYPHFLDLRIYGSVHFSFFG